LVDPSFIESIGSSDDEEDFLLFVAVLMKCDGIHLFAHHAHHDFVPTRKVFFECLDDCIRIFLDSMRLAISFAGFNYLDGQVFAKSFDVLITGTTKMFVTV